MNSDRLENLNFIYSAQHAWKSQKAPLSTVIILSLLFISVNSPVFGEEEGSVKLQLQDVLRLALSRSLQLKYQELEPEIAGQRLEYERAIYDSSLSLRSVSRTFPGSVAGFTGQERVSEMESALSVVRKSHLGGESSLGMSFSKSPALLREDGLNGLYTTKLYLRHEQPMLKGAGERIASLEISKAAIRTNTAGRALAAGRNQALLEVFREYAAWFRACEQLRSQQAIRAKAAEIYNIVQEKTDKRQLPITELNTMKTTLASIDADILTLQNARRNKCQSLIFAAVNEPENQKSFAYTPATSPGDVIAGFALPASTDTFAKAVALDLSLIALESDLALIEEDCLKACDDCRPNLTMSVQGGVDGVSQDSWTDATGGVSARNYDVQVGAILELPISDRAANSRLAELRFRKEQMQFLILKRRNEIQHNIEELYRNLEESKKRITLNEQIVVLSRENLENGKERLIAGKITVLDTLIYQTDLIRAEFDLVQNGTDFMNLIGTCKVLRGEMEQFTEVKTETGGSR